MLNLDDIQEALSNDRVVPLLQPIHRATTGELYGAEVLARIIDYKQSVITPNFFLTEIEDSDLIIPFTLTLMKKVMDIINFIPVKYKSQFCISFNVPANILSHSAFIMGAKLFLRNTPEKIRLIIEVTEREIFPVCPEEIKLIRSLVAEGISLWLDDFGTGYSNFNSLKTGLFSGIKIPREFVQDVGINKLIDVLRQSITETGKRLHMVVIAEGVETMSQLNSIINERVDLVQGFLFSPPLCAKAFINYINNHPSSFIVDG